MKINAHWQRHVEAWRKSGLSQADYCRQQGLNHKTFSVWTRRVQDDLSLNKDVPVEFISVQVAPLVTDKTLMIYDSGSIKHLAHRHCSMVTDWPLKRHWLQPSHTYLLRRR